MYESLNEQEREIINKLRADSIKQKMSIIISVLIILAVFWLVGAVTEISDLKCNKQEDVCRVYTGTLFTPKELSQQFKISDIRTYIIEEYRHSSRHSHYTSYYPVLIMKTGERESLYSFSSRQRENAEDTVFGIFNYASYEKKGSFWKSVMDTY